jgi:hypothetical protein
MKGGSALLHNSKIFFFTMRAAVGLVSIQPITFRKVPDGYRRACGTG